MKSAMEAVGAVLVKERKARDQMRDELRAEFRAELERQVMALRVEFLQQQLDQTRNVSRLKTVGPSGAMIA
jgi:hypothetical protein